MSMMIIHFDNAKMQSVVCLVLVRMETVMLVLLALPGPDSVLRGSILVGLWKGTNILI